MMTQFQIQTKNKNSDSWVWKFFIIYYETINGKNVRHGKCKFKLCMAVLVADDSTSSIIKHLNKVHKICEEDCNIFQVLSEIDMLNEPTWLKIYKISIAFAVSSIAYYVIEKDSYTKAFQTYNLTQHLLKNNTLQIGDDLENY